MNRPVRRSCPPPVSRPAVLTLQRAAPQPSTEKLLSRLTGRRREKKPRSISQPV